MDYRRFVTMSTAVPDLYRNSGVLKYGGKRKEEDNGTSGGPRRQDLQVRPCLPGSTIEEFKFEMGLLKVIEVIKQINDNFIAALAVSPDKKVLILMDQHAIHERIRYENLLKDYTTQDGKVFISIELDVPIVIKDLPIRLCEWLLAHSNEVERSGLRLKSEKMGCLVIRSIPKCFDRKKLNQSRAELEITVRKLLVQITNDLDNDYSPSINIPMVIHHAIATEACHGAVKFGEQLNTDQCTQLVRGLMDTEAPSRCAHGRPSVIPLLELKDSKNNQRLIPPKIPTIYQPENNGWIQEDNQYHFKWFEGDQLPNDVRESLKTFAETNEEDDIDQDKAMDRSSSDEDDDDDNHNDNYE